MARLEAQLLAADRLVGPLGAGAQVAEEPRPIVGQNRRNQRHANQARARPPEQGRRGQVDLHDHAGRVEGAVAVRGRIVQGDVAVARFLELLQRCDQLLVLRAQLLLVHLEVVAQHGPVVVRAGDWLRRRTAATFGHRLTRPLGP
jgi:hypothetical protein